MNEAKYGRLFTEADVSAIGMHLQLGAPSVGAAVALLDADPSAWPSGGPYAFTFPADEPLFLLRAQDHHAAEAIEAYQHSCDIAPSVETSHCEGVRRAWREFTDWQHDNPERVKEPT